MYRLPFLQSIDEFMLVRHYNKRTISTDITWIRVYILFHAKRHPEKMGKPEVVEFLTCLAADCTVSVSTQRVALNALAFLYNRFLEKPLGDLPDFKRASRQAKLPAVLPLSVG